MKTSIGRAKYLLYVILLTAGLMGWLVLPQIPPGQAITSAHVSNLKFSSQNPSGSGLDAARESALQQLYSQLNAGAPFSEEETYVLRRFGGGYVVSELEADILISRALYELYIKGNQLTTQQQELLDRYKPFVAERGRAIADYKKQLLDQRIAAAAAAPPQSAPAVAPPNDLCSGAVVIPAAGPFPFLTTVTTDITGATTTGDPPLPSCQSSVSRSIWYKFTPSTTAVYSISACSSETATTVDDTVMAIYTSTGACAGPFTEIPTSGLSNGCDDDSDCSAQFLQSILTTQLNAGTSYFIVVWEFGTAPPPAGKTAVQLKVTLSSPSNDNCAGAVALILNSSVMGTTRFAINDYELPMGSTCFTGIGQTASTAPGRDVVYSFTAPMADSYSFRVNLYSNQNVVLSVASNCPTGTPPLFPTCLGASNRNPLTQNSAEEVRCLPLAANQTVFVFVDENTLNTITTGSTFLIEVTKCTSETESNDTPATANTLTCGIEGAISPAGDVDFYSLGTPASGSRVFALVDGAAANTSDFDMRITTSTDTLEFDTGDNDAPFGQSSPNVAGTPLTGVPAFIRVGAAAESLPYRLYAAVQPPGGGPGNTSATTETEPNDTPLQADSATNNYFYGTLSGPAPSLDADIFSFQAAAGDVVFLSLDGDPLRDNTPINAMLELLDASEAALISVNDGSSTSSTTASPGTLTGVTPFSPAEGLVFRVATAGTYYARVRISPSATGTTGAGDYLLSISLNCVAACAVSISPPSKSFSASSGTGSVNVTATNGCSWTAGTNDSFINITSGSTGNGNGTVNYTVAANNANTPRTGNITIANQTFPVLQGATFLDVPVDYPFYTEIGKLSARGVTLGCGGGNYCPDASVTREQMAAFIIRALGMPNPPTPSQQRFADVPPSNQFYAFIEEMAIRGITLGCGTNAQGQPLYCPSSPVTREQMAAFIIRALGEFNPPTPMSQRFNDVPPSNIFYNFIDRMAVLQITLGCSVSPPLYCPSNSVTRGQMAAFLVRAFGL